jgi:predicted RNA-binding Zn-ribbon protein involved in translation (DUF1610 family)
MSKYFDEDDTEYSCPKCGSGDTHVKRFYEKDDADGNRGEWVTYLFCNDCGYEE